MRTQTGILRRWTDPKKLRRADRRRVDRVLQEHGMRNEEKRKETIDRIRNSALLCDDVALIDPMSMTVNHLTSLIEASVKAIEQFDQKISEVFQSHEEANLFASLRGAGPKLAPRLLCAFGSDRDRWSSADDWLLSAESHQSPAKVLH